MNIRQKMKQFDQANPGILDLEMWQSPVTKGMIRRLKGKMAKYKAINEVVHGSRPDLQVDITLGKGDIYRLYNRDGIAYAKMIKGE